MSLTRSNIIHVLFTYILICVSNLTVAQSDFMINEIDYSPDGKFISIAGEGVIQVFHVENQSIYQTLLNLPTAEILDVDWSADSKQLAAVVLDTSLPQGEALKIWQIDDDAEYRAGTLIINVDPIMERLAVAHSMDWGNNGIIAVSTPYSGVFLWNDTTFDEDDVIGTTGRFNILLGTGISKNKLVSLAPIEGFSSISNIKDKPNKSYDLGSSNRIAIGASFSLDGTLLAVSYTDGTIEILDSTTYAVTQIIQANQFYSKIGMQWHPDGNLLATTNFHDEKVKFWDIDAGILIATVPAQSSSLSFSPDGQHIAYRSLTGELEIMALDDLNLLATSEIASG